MVPIQGLACVALSSCGVSEVFSPACPGKVTMRRVGGWQLSLRIASLRISELGVPGHITPDVACSSARKPACGTMHNIIHDMPDCVTSTQQKIKHGQWSNHVGRPEPMSHVACKLSTHTQKCHCGSCQRHNIPAHGAQSPAKKKGRQLPPRSRWPSINGCAGSHVAVVNPTSSKTFNGTPSLHLPAGKYEHWPYQKTILAPGATTSGYFPISLWSLSNSRISDRCRPPCSGRKGQIPSRIPAWPSPDTCALSPCVPPHRTIMLPWPTP